MKALSTAALSRIETEGAGGTGTVKIQAQACDDFTPSNTVDIPFKYRVNSTGDTWGALTDSAATGYTTSAGANKKVAVEVDARQLPEGYNKVRIKLTEVVNDPCLAGLSYILSKPRNSMAVLPTAIA